MSHATPVVLYVEDDADQRHFMVGLLEADGLRVVQASDGEAALRVLRGGLIPDVVLTDLKLPRMSGPEFVMAIWALPACENLPIAVLTEAERPLRGTPLSVAVFQKPRGLTVPVGEIRGIPRDQFAPPPSVWTAIADPSA